MAKFGIALGSGPRGLGFESRYSDQTNNRHRLMEQCRLFKNSPGGICMPDYKAMYYHLAGRMATAIDALEATTNALVDITEKLKLAQQTTEEMFLSSPGDDEDAPDNDSISV